LLAPSTEAQNCTAANEGLNAIPGQSNNWYHEIDETGARVRNHGPGYFPIAATSSQDGMADRDAWVTSTTAPMPIYPGTDDPSVRIITGWVYANGNSHNAIDYARNEGGRFPVYAMADGEVIWKGYAASPGNVVIIQHTAPSGERFRTIYHHLIDGRDHDIAFAKATLNYCASRTCDGDAWQRYQDRAEAAELALALDPSDQEVERVWGTNETRVSVNEGDVVRGGDLIAYAGTTGAHSGGIHAHVMFARRAPHKKAGGNVSRWTFFDPYGLYAQPKEFYQVDCPTGEGGALQHASVIAPFFHKFTGVDSSTFQRGLDYFAAHGLYPEALTTEHVPGSGKMVAGSFVIDSDEPVVRHLRSFNGYQDDFEYWRDRGWKPRQTSVVVAPNSTRYTTIYGPITDRFWTSHKMTANWFSSRFQELYSTHVLTDVAPYSENGTLYFSAMWEKRSHNGYAMYFGMTKSNFLARHADYVSRGLNLQRLYQYAHPGSGTRYAALWTREGPDTYYWTGLDAETYRSYSKGLSPYGFRVTHLSVNGGRYNVVWTWDWN
jgi:hypothetical protein